ncbi:hypothetical protein JMJ55_18935 [Belnapia sp. T6]|uniref:Uncharacterized protein n=1 Tax=Belnapia mucosa TaxID=2804532 RepID=A0ABS1V9K0_9PROT|nr:hypothetical protein [Belnapia mucosa]MBL6457414.1 hypothetical protein [Belnapia mucosa]
MGEAQDIVDYATQPTDYLPHVITRCIDKANKHGYRVRFALNGADVVVHPGQSAAEVDAEVQRQWQAAAERRVPKETSANSD